VAVVNDAAAQDRAIEQLREALPGRTVHVVRLNRDTTDVLEAVLEQLPAGRAEGPVMVTGWGDTLPFGGGNGSLLSGLNLSRPRWPGSLPVPVVFWVPQDVLGRMLREAPDFLDWRSDTCRLPDMLPSDLQTFRMIETADGTDWGTPVEVSRERIRELESRLAAHRGSTDPVVQAACARWLFDLGNHRHLLGREEESAEAYGEGLALARSVHGHISEEVAGFLNNLADSLRGLGHREEALQAAQEAMAIYRGLAERRPDAFLPNLAGSLNNLGNMLSELGRREEALQAAQEAVTIHRGLAERRPDAFLPDLAGSLNNLGLMLSDLGRREEALQAGQEAVAVYRGLAERRPDAFLPDLATSLNNLGNRLSDLGRREEALQTAQEAVTIYRGLAERRADAFLPDLATSLRALHLSHRALGQYAEARAAIGEAMHLLTPLFVNLPQAFGHMMARIVRDYLEVSREAGEEPDVGLLAPVVATFERLRQQEGEWPQMNTDEHR